MPLRLVDGRQQVLIPSQLKLLPPKMMGLSSRQITLVPYRGRVNPASRPWSLREEALGHPGVNVHRCHPFQFLTRPGRLNLPQTGIDDAHKSCSKGFENSGSTSAAAGSKVVQYSSFRLTKHNSRSRPKGIVELRLVDGEVRALDPQIVIASDRTSVF